MNAKQASTQLRQFAGVFQAAKDLEEIFTLAASIENATEERKRLLAEQDNALANIKGKVNEAEAGEAKRSLAAEKAHAERISKINDEFESLTQGFEFAKKEMAREADEAQKAHAANIDALANEIRDLTQTRDSLLQSVTELQAQIETLKARVAAA